MRKDNVDCMGQIRDSASGDGCLTVVKLQILQTLVEALDNVLPAETAGVVRVGSLCAEKDLGGDDDVTTILTASANKSSTGHGEWAS